MRALSRGLRFGGVLAAGALVLAACGSSPSSTSPLHPSTHKAGYANTPDAYGELPNAHGTAQSGGIVSFAESPGAGPDYIFPITPSADGSVYTAYQFQELMWRPLWWSPSGDAVPSIDYTDSLAGAPVFSDSNKTITIHMKSGWNWANCASGTCVKDGAVTATDLLFDYWLTLAAITISPANDGNFTPGLYPQNVTSMTAPNATTLVIKLSKTYNQDFDFYSQIGVLAPLPAQAWAKTSTSGAIIPASGWENLATAKKIYTFLAGQSKGLSSYASNPLWQVVDGPFHLKSFDAATEGNEMLTNTQYSGHMPKIAGIKEVSFTSTSAEFDELKTGALDVGYVDYSDLADVGSISSSYDIWGYPNFGWEYVVYNFKDTTGHFNDIINQLYIRQALAHLQDEQAVIKSKGIFDGAAAPAYYSTPVVPKSPLVPAAAGTDPYPFSISAAKSILSSHGWKVVPGGTSTCVKPGTASDECGAGIPAGTPLSWNLLAGNSPAVLQAQCEAWASNAKQVGIEMSISEKTFDYIISELSDVSAPSNDSKWAMEDFGGFTGVLYPTTNEVFNTTGSYNEGGFSNKQMDSAINNSIYSLSNSAVGQEAILTGKLMPGLFQPNPDLIFAISKKLSGPPADFENMSQYVITPEYWYFIK